MYFYDEQVVVSDDDVVVVGEDYLRCFYLSKLIP